MQTLSTPHAAEPHPLHPFAQHRWSSVLPLHSTADHPYLSRYIWSSRIKIKRLQTEHLLLPGEVAFLFQEVGNNI